MVIRKLKDGANELKRRARKRTIEAIVAAFAFVIALVWRDAIKKMIDALALRMGFPETAYVHDVILALLITVVCVIGIMVFSRWEVKE